MMVGEIEFEGKDSMVNSIIGEYDGVIGGG